MTQKIQFTDPRNTKTVSLPSFPGSEIVMFEKLLVEDQSQIFNQYPNAKTNISEGFDAGIAMVAKAIKSHNFYDGDEPIILDVKTLKKLPESDLVFLIDIVTPKKKPEEEKKD